MKYKVPTMRCLIAIVASIQLAACSSTSVWMPVAGRNAAVGIVMRKPAPLAGVAQEQHLQMLATMLGKSLAEKGVEIAPLPRGFAPENIRLEADQIAAFRVLLELQLQTSFLPLKAVDAGAPQWAFSVNMIIHHLTAFPASRFCSAVTMPVARFSELQSADVIVPALRSCIQQLEPVDLP